MKATKEDTKKRMVTMKDSGTTIKNMELENMYGLLEISKVMSM